MATKVLTSRQWRVWVQPDGPGTAVYPLSCKELGDLSAEDGSVEPIRCFNDAGDGYDTVGQTVGEPGKVSFSIDTLLEADRDWLELNGCPGSLYVMARDCGRADLFTNYVRGQIVPDYRRTKRTYSDLVKQKEDVESKFSADFEATELLDVDVLTGGAVTNAIAEAIKSIATLNERRCKDDCGETIDPGEIVVTGGDATGAAAGVVTYNANFMTTLTATAAAPFAVGAAKHVVSVGLCYIDRTTLRIIACKAAEPAVQGVIAYSDDLGATWTTVNIGGVVAHGATKQGSLFVMDYRHIWLGSDLGFIYFSNNGGQTWTAQEGGVIQVGYWAAVHFADKEYGMAVGETDEIALTNDGGVTWYAPATTTGSAGNLTACVRFDRNRMLIGDSVGNLYLSEDAGATWAAIAWPGAAGGAIDDIKFLNEYEGLVSQFAGATDGVIWQTVNGGFDWVTVYTSAEELYGLAYVNTRLAYAVGEDGAGLATAVKLTSGSAIP